jgi:predicted DNA-binding protein (UPF0251 family)
MSTHLSKLKSFDPADWISQSEAARLRGISRQAISNLVAKGRFKTLIIAGKTLLCRSDVEKFQPNPAGRPAKRKRAKKK